MGCTNKIESEASWNSSVKAFEPAVLLMQKEKESTA